MAYNFNYLLIDSTLGILNNMPPIDIDKRTTDKNILYNKTKTRLDRIASDVYDDETFWKIILWANPEFSCEYDIPDNTVIRVPYPKIEVFEEVTKKIVTKKNIG